MEPDEEPEMLFTDAQAKLLCLFFSIMAIIYGIGKLLSILGWLHFNFRDAYNRVKKCNWFIRIYNMPSSAKE